MYERILLPLDGSALAAQAIPYGVAQAQRFDAEVILLRIFEPLPDLVRVSGKAVEEALQRSRQLALEYLDRLASDSRSGGVASRVEIVEGRPYGRLCGSVRTAT